MAKIKSMIGCELATNEIRAVEITKNNGVYQILAMGYIPLESGIIEEGFIRDANRFQEAFSELMSSGGFRSNNLVIAVNNENVMMRYAAFPKVDSEKLRSMILLQAQEFIPVPISEMEVDYVIAGESTNEDNASQYNIMLVAARKQMLEGYINHFTAMKYTVNDIDSSLLAFCRGIKNTNEDKKYCIVNYTNDILNFIVVKGEQIFMVRSITIPDRNRTAVDSLFDLVKKEENEDEAEFEYQKEELIKNAVSFIISETASTVSYYSMQSDEPIEKIYYIAHSCYDSRVLNEFQENMPIPVEKPHLYSELQNDVSAEINNYASCIGVAISGLEG